ncbi:hypothetical protein [Clostridium weizhouense]|uniref:ABM domain-containing protein n=1 Tax=Clostridium weizhouense TaxID=2859781 RepID=A0ABS7APM1_9CLOT|nr:hypothetical protein [Clostridium weizhouense]MBW6409651.1 hypothetical protein [Clostridium weizhouense]
MNNYNALYNVNEIVVKPELEDSYKKFSKKLNNYLLKKYNKYYAGLQLYESNEYYNRFFVVARYKDVCGLYKVITKIVKDIENIYDKIWGCYVQRMPIFSFLDYTKVIPHQH